MNDQVIRWNKTAVKEDIMSFPPEHQVAQFFSDVDGQVIENFMEDCTTKTLIELMEKLCFECRHAYTKSQKRELRGIIKEYGAIIAENMCINVLFGVGCECNDFEGNPLVNPNTVG